MKRIGFWSIALIAMLAVLFFAATALACTPLGVGKDASVDGSVMVSHTCDGWYDQRIVIIPRRPPMPKARWWIFTRTPALPHGLIGSL